MDRGRNQAQPVEQRIHDATDARAGIGGAGAARNAVRHHGRASARRSASLIRSCYPGPVARNFSITSGSRRIEINTFSALSAARACALPTWTPVPRHEPPRRVSPAQNRRWSIPGFRRTPVGNGTEGTRGDFRHASFPARLGAALAFLAAAPPRPRASPWSGFSVETLAAKIEI